VSDGPSDPSGSTELAGSTAGSTGSTAGAPDRDLAGPGGRPPRRRRVLERLGRSRVAFVLWVVAVTLVLVTVAFRATTQLGPGTVQARFTPSLDGGTELAVPPLGSVRADTHVAPVRLRVELRELDLLDALGPDDDRGVRGIEQEVYDDIPGAIRELALLAAAGAALAGLGAALAFPGRRSLGRLATGAVLGPVVVGALLAPAAIGFAPERFEDQPQLAGPLRTAPELLQQVGSLQTRFGSVQSRTQVLAERITGLYSAAVTGDISRSDGEVVLLHVSDLHLNAVGLSLAQDLARSFQVDAVVDTGDITSFGFGLEAGFVDLLEGFEVPYYVIAGNHDSEEVRVQLARSDAVQYLDDEAVEIAGLTVLGVGDPTVTALRDIPSAQIDRTYRRQHASTRRLVRAEQPDLLLVHNPVQARPVVGDVPAVAAGHLHRNTIEVVDGSVLTVLGSSGAAGLENLLVDEGEPYRFQLLRFLDGDLVAIDQIELRGAGGDFFLERRLIGPDEEETEGDVLDEQVDEPSLEEVDEDDLEQLPTSTSTTGSEDGSGASTGSSTSTSEPDG
jgi:predicted MPP superfamily phosphohydrolase